MAKRRKKRRSKREVKVRRKRRQKRGAKIRTVEQLEAVRVVYAALAPLEIDDRQRVVAAAIVLLGGVEVAGIKIVGGAE